MDHNLNQFYIIIPPGLEEMAFAELREKWSIHFPEINFPKTVLGLGGIEIETTLELGFSLNRILKVPNRILLRLASFKCRDFPKLFNKLKKIPWNNYLLGQIPEIKSSAKKSRIFDSRKIEQTAKDAIKAHYKSQAPKKKSLDKISLAPSMSIYLRFDEDLCQLAVDTSGERLHKRGTRPYIGAAPLRENLAAGLVYYFKKNAGEKPISLIDPMCGSGTFLLEASSFFDIVTTRVFSFEYFPLTNNLVIPTLENPDEELFLDYKGMDKDESVLQAALKNTSLSKKSIELKVADLYQDHEKSSGGGVILNPPYGKRIDLEGNVAKMIEQIRKKFSPELIGILIPESVPFNFKVKKELSLSNGGIKVKFYLV